MKKTIYIFILIFSQSLLAQIYYGAGVGYSRYSNDSLKSKNQVSAGPRFGALLGYKLAPAPLAFEAFLNSTKTETDALVDSDGNKYIYHANILSYGILGKYFIGNFHLRAGYAFHHFDTFLTEEKTAVVIQSQSIKNSFGVEDKTTYSGPLFGAGYDIPLPYVSPYIVLTSYQLNSTNGDIFELELGVKFHF